MNKIELMQLVTDQNFNEVAYLAANPDVAKAVQSGQFESGRRHYEAFGKREKRVQRQLLPIAAKQTKLEKVKQLLRSDMAFHRTGQFYDFLTEDLRKQFNIVDTEAVSSNGYDPHVLGLIEKHSQGMILDCGAGMRPTYFDNVINFEIVPYDTTDVRGVGEILPYH